MPLIMSRRLRCKPQFFGRLIRWVAHPMELRKEPIGPSSSHLPVASETPRKTTLFRFGIHVVNLQPAEVAQTAGLDCLFFAPEDASAAAFSVVPQIASVDGPKWDQLCGSIGSPRRVDYMWTQISSLLLHRPARPVNDSCSVVPP